MSVVSNSENAKYWMITCLYNGLCLDSNTIAAKQCDKTHRRICLSVPNVCFHKHRWKLKKVTEEENVFMLITDSFIKGEEFSLDGNIQSHIKQWDYAFPSPFLWDVRETHENHHWKLIPVSDNDPYTFFIVNKQHGKCLDGNVDLCDHVDPKFKSPFLTQFNPQKALQGQMWKIQPIIEITQNEIPSGYYLIINVATDQCLDSNVQKAEQTSILTPRIFMGQKTNYNPCLHWFVKGTENNEYVLMPRFEPEAKQLSGKCNESTELAPPSLVNTESLFFSNSNLDLSNQSNRHWKFFPAPSRPNTFLITCVANGLCIDGNNELNQLIPPFMSKLDLTDATATTRMWYLKPIKQAKI